MAYKCGYCGSAKTQQMANRYQCLDCGHQTNMDGSKGEGGFEWTSEVPLGTEAHTRATAWAVHDQRGDTVSDEDAVVDMEHKLGGTEGKTKPLTEKQQAENPELDAQIPDKAVNKTMGKDPYVQYDERGEPLKYHDKDDREEIKELAEDPPAETPDGDFELIDAPEEGDDMTTTENFGRGKSKAKKAAKK